jgi:3-oxoacyl-[acyl-carrier-protein] synthase III
VKRPVVYLSGTGRSLPRTEVTNAEFAAMGLDTTDDWIVERSGIRTRRIAKEGESTTSMAADAARQAMSRANITAGEVDAILLSTATPDRLLPATAVEVQAALGATRAYAFDISAACSGWVYGLTIAEGMIAAGHAETMLVIGSEKLSTIVDWTDRSTCVLFGDAAGAAVVQRSKHHRGILSSFLRSDGTLADLLHRSHGGAAAPITEQVLRDKSQYVRMNGREVFRYSVRSMAEATDRALDAARLTGRDIDLFIPHQANIRIIEATAKHANIPIEKVYINVDRYGNTSSASIPVALDEAIEYGRVTEGSTVLFVAFGSGFTWASMVVRF